MTNPLFSRLTIHRQQYQFDSVAPWVSTLPNIGAKENDTYVLSEDSGTPAGLYIRIGNVFRFVIPVEPVVDAFRENSTIDLYYDLRAAAQVTGSVYTNGIPSSITTIPIGAGSVHGVITKSGSGAGTVTSVNGEGPDATGNVVLKQMIEYDISVPFSPSPDSTLLYQELVANSKYVSGSASSPDTPATPVTFDLLLNGTSVGSLVIGPGGASLTTTLTNVNASDVLTIVSPPLVEGVTMFSLSLTFERT